MNEFEEQWVCATLAPEACIRVKSDDIKGNYLNVIYNHDKTIRVFVLSNKTHIQALGLDYASLLLSPNYRFDKGLHKIAQLLQLESITV